MTIGYLPQEKPRTAKELVLFAFQQLLVMMPATVTVALITGFHTSTTIFASGLATIVALVATAGRIPLYYGSSFAYLPAILAITMANYGEVAPDETIRVAQFGIIMSGLVSIAVGLAVKTVGMKAVKTFLPASITGPVAAIIGLSLAVTALTSAIGYDAASDTMSLPSSWWLAIVAILATTVFSCVFKRGILSQIPILLGIAVAYCVAAVTGYVDFSPIVSGGLVSAPHITFPLVNWGAALSIMPITLATIPESTAHLVQLDNGVNSLVEERRAALRARLARNPERDPSWPQRLQISSLLWLSLIADGIGDIVAGIFGGPGGTNYGENLSTMQITRVYSKYVIGLAGVLAILASFLAPLSGLFSSIPSSVFNGTCIFLFGVIAWQGISIMHNEWAEVSSRRGIAVSAVVLIFGIGGTYGFSSGIPFLGWNVPAIAFAAIFGIVLNVILLGAEKLGNGHTA